MTTRLANAQYLEVQYYCYDVNSQNATTTNKGAPSGGRLTTASPVISGGQQQAAEQTGAAAPSPSHKSQAGQSVGGGSSQEAAGLSLGEQLRTSGNNSVDNSAPAAAFIQEQQAVIQQQNHHHHQQRPAALFCRPQTSARGLSWEATPVGQVARQPCPEGATGRVTWLCDIERARSGQTTALPDFSQCRSIWLARLGHQLEQLLALDGQARQASWTSSGEAGQRQQDEQMIKSILGELSLMGKTRKLFSEDLKRIELMVGQMIGQLRSLAAAPQTWQVGGGEPSSGLSATSMQEELFVKVGQLVSSLFDLDQRSAWLELPSNGARNWLEQRLLGHLKEAGLLLARSLPVEQQSGAGSSELAAVRQPNLVASISAMPSDQVTIEESFPGELNLLTPSGASPMSARQTVMPAQATELRLSAALAKELWANGVNKFLILDVRKPDYSLIKLAQEQQQQAAAGDFASTVEGLASGTEQLAQYQARVFADSSAMLDAPQRLADLLAGQWPVSVDFKLTQATGDLQPQQQAPVRHYCQALDGGLEATAVANQVTGSGQRSSTPLACQLARANATNLLCACNKLAPNGFVQLLQQQPVQSNDPFGAQWPPVATTGGDMMTLPNGNELSPAQQLDPRFPPDFVISNQAGQQQSQQSPGFLATCFIVIGASLLVLAAAGLIVGAALRLLNSGSVKKAPVSFFSSSRAPTTGPLVASGADLHHHSLMHAASATEQPHNFIVGLNRASQLCSGGTLSGSVGSNYKPHQALYAQGPVLEAYSSGASSPRTGKGALGHLVNWLLQRGGGGRRAGNTWLSSDEHHHQKQLEQVKSVQHRIIGGAQQTALIDGANQTAATTLAYHSHQQHKNAYQNGYTTTLSLRQAHQQQQQMLHNSNTQHHHHHLRAQMSSTGSGAPLNSSSNSSYVSSSAYYEEIATTKPNASNTTLVDPFKRPTTTHEFGLSNGGGAPMIATSQQQQQHPFNQQQLAWSQQQQQASAQAISSYQIEQPQHLHTDLSPLQSSSSSSSAGATTTPRHHQHYLFGPMQNAAYKQQPQQQQQFNRNLQQN